MGAKSFDIGYPPVPVRRAIDHVAVCEVELACCLGAVEGASRIPSFYRPGFESGE
jgi:hypothetical protein